MQGGLVAIEHHELGGRKLADLTAQLGTDRAAGAGDEYALAVKEAGDRCESVSTWWRPRKSSVSCRGRR